MNHRSNSNSLAWWAGGLVLAGLALTVFSQPAPRPANRPAAGPPAQLRVEATPTPAAAPIEQRAGGRLVRGQWWFGYTPNPAATRAFIASLPKPTLRQAAPEILARANDRTPVLLYRSLYKAHAAYHAGDPWVVGAQGIGDCVGWGWGHGVDIQGAVSWELGDAPEWRTSATEAIYGGSRVEARCGSDSCRGGYRDGSYGGAAAKFVHDFGILFRQPYPDLGFDLTEYSSRRAKDWGNYGCGGQGDNGKADQVAKLHAVQQVVLCRTFEEAASLISAGYPVPVCSGRGFSSRRDADGFCQASGSWSHCMCFVAVRYAPRPGLLCLNSWGPDWVEGPKWPDDMPDGSFWVEPKVAEGMLAGEDSFAVSGPGGFTWRDLHHGDWAVVEPAQTRQIARRRASPWGNRAPTLSLTLAP